MELVNIPNYYEELIDKMMIEEVSGLDEEIKSHLIGLDLSKKRLAILSILDKNRSLFLKTRDLILQNKISKTEHIKNIVSMLREYVKVGDVEKKKFGEVMTPIELVEEMLDQLPAEVWSNPDLKWLDPANGCGVFPCVVVERLMAGLKDWEVDEEKRYKHIMENMIYVCELQPKNMFLYLCCFDPEDKYFLNIHTGSFLEEDFDVKMKEIWGVDKFDIIIGNPPYQSYLHLKIQDKSVKILKENCYLIFLQPSQQYLDIKPKSITKIEQNIINYLEKYITKLTLINGNLLFQVQMFFTPLSITFLKKTLGNSRIEVTDKTKNITYDYPSIKEVNYLGYSRAYISLKSKLEEIIKKFGNINSISKKIGNYYIGLSEIRGHVNMTTMIDKDFYTLVSRNQEINKEPKNKYYNAGFETIEEAQNFLDYLKTDFARICLAYYKINSTLAGTAKVLNLIPLLDFKETWNDEKLYNFFNISDEQKQFIQSIIPKYY